MPSRISFKGTLDTARHFADVIHVASSKPRRQDQLIEEMLALIASDLIVQKNEDQGTTNSSPNPARKWAMFPTEIAPTKIVLNPP